MAESVPPIVRDEFVYRDVLLVDVGGDLKRHPRATEAEIKTLLNGKNVKDRVGHWWEAQLIHYGLQRSKQKDTAKVRLQQAISQGKLKGQPPHLADLESQMKKDYAAAVRKAKKPVADSGRGTKRAREGQVESSAKKTKTPVKVGDLSTALDQSAASTSKKENTKATPAKSAASRKIAQPKKVARAPATKKPTTQSMADSEPAASHFDSENVFQRSSDPPRRKMTARKSAPWTGPTRQEWESAAPRDHPDNVFQHSSSASKTPTSIKKESSIKPEPGANHSMPNISRTAPIKRSGYFFDADAMDTRADVSERPLNITGVYTLECPQIAEQLPDQQDKLRLFICVDHESGVTWGGFELAMKSGTIKMDEIDFSKRLTFGWRARDSWEGSLRFGKSCFGDIEFDGNGHIWGTFQNLFNEPMSFQGVRRPGPLWAGKSAYKFEQDWNAYPKEAYGR